MINNSDNQNDHKYNFIQIKKNNLCNNVISRFICYRSDINK